MILIGQMTEDRRQRTDDGRQTTENRGQRTEDREQMSEDRGQREDDRRQRIHRLIQHAGQIKRALDADLASVFCYLDTDT